VTSPTPPTAFLEPAVLARISDLALLARTVVDGFMHGLHRSSRMGLSLDFAEHRPYQPGDDIRRIDWRAYGRTDRYYVKEYEADTNAAVVFALDASASMDFGGGGGPLTKFHYGRCLVASLAWLAQRQGDRVGLVTFTGDLVEVVPPSTRHLPLLLHALGRARAAGSGRLPLALERVARIATRAGIVVLVTDCYEDPADLARGVGTLRARGHDVIVFHVLDPAERDLPWTAPGTFEDAESGVRIPLRPDELRSGYRRAVESHRRDLAQRLAGTGSDYEVVETDRPLDHGLYAFLDRRLALSRLR
jgi:uncharacterized protein (DUF58 family)